MGVPCGRKVRGGKKRFVRGRQVRLRHFEGIMASTACESANDEFAAFFSCRLFTKVPTYLRGGQGKVREE